MPGRVSDKTLIKDFLKKHPIATIADFRDVKPHVIEDVIRKALLGQVELLQTDPALEEVPDVSHAEMALSEVPYSQPLLVGPERDMIGAPASKSGENLMAELP